MCFVLPPRVWNCNVITCVELCALCDQSCALYVVSVSAELCVLCIVSISVKIVM